MESSFRLNRAFQSAIVAVVALCFGCVPSKAVDEVYTVDKGSTPAPVVGQLPEGTTTVVPPPAEPFVSPLGAKKAAILSGFGPRHAPGVTDKTEAHEGIDYRVAPGTAVRAARSGKVLFAGFSTAYTSRIDKKDKHRLVIVRHADGTSSRYVHLKSILVKPQQPVQAGTTLGTASESDEWTEPVLHFEIRDAVGRALDPEDVFATPLVP